jgi:hypothetical protein
MRRATRLFGAGALALAFLVGPAGRPARAEITFYDLIKSMDYIQTGPSAPVAPVEYDGNAGIASAVGDFTNASITSSSPISPFGLTVFPGDASFFIALATKAQLDADIPNGTTYTFNVSGGGVGTQSATLTLPSTDEYAANVPFLTGGSYNALQGMNASAPLTLTFDPFAAVAGTNFDFMIVDFYPAGNSQPLINADLANTASSYALAANTLQPNTSYTFALSYFVNNFTSNAGFGQATDEYGYSESTFVHFTTGPAAVPEPSALAGAATGISIVLGYWWRRRKNAVA